MGTVIGVLGLIRVSCRHIMSGSVSVISLRSNVILECMPFTFQDIIFSGCFTRLLVIVSISVSCYYLVGVAFDSTLT